MALSDLALKSDVGARRPSTSSGAASPTGIIGLLTPIDSPDPAFISASAASQIVAESYESQSITWYDQNAIEPSGGMVHVAPSAMKLVNHFLDQLLFSFLSVSRSTCLESLRPAISEVLQSKLAKSAIGAADRELHDYMGSDEDAHEILLALDHGRGTQCDQDLDLIWKRTRLRCMLYSSLGDMEEDEKDFYAEQEHFDTPESLNDCDSNPLGFVSPAVAIFLTSVLEFIGEQVVTIAGHAAYHRMQARHQKEITDDIALYGDIAEPVVVEEADVERVALDMTLGRLWRAWKKRVRSTAISTSMPRSFSPDSVKSMSQTSECDGVLPNITGDGQIRTLSQANAQVDAEITSKLLPKKHDSQEMEIPDLNYNLDNGDDTLDLTSSSIRRRSIRHPRSFMLLTSADPELCTSSLISGRKRPTSFPSSKILISSRRASKKIRISESDTDPEADSIKNVGGSEDAAETNDLEKLQARGMVAGKKGTIISPTLTHKSRKPDCSAGEGESGNEFTEEALDVRRDVSVAEVAAEANAEVTPIAIGNGHDDAGEDELEEPQIMISHRISIHEGISADTRPSSRNSIRVVDVPSPRSPCRPSRYSPFEDIDDGNWPLPTPTRPGSIKLPVRSGSQSPRIGSPLARSFTSSPSVMKESGRSIIGDSISEVDELIVPEMKSQNSVVGDERPPDTEGRQASLPISPTPAAFAAAVQGIEIVGTGVGHISSEAKEKKRPVPIDTTHKKEKKRPGPIFTTHKEKKRPGPIITDLLRKLPSTPTFDRFNSLSSPKSPKSRSKSNTLVRPVPKTPTQADHPSPLLSPLFTKEEKRLVSPGFPKRPIHTSSSVSSLASQKAKTVRTSEDSTSGNFEQLIHSDQTIQYTLTPLNMRDVNAPESPSFIGGKIVDGKSVRGRSGSSSITKYVAVYSNMVSEAPKEHDVPNPHVIPEIRDDVDVRGDPKVPDTANTPQAPKPNKPTTTFTTIPRPTSNRISTHRQNAPQPRDARISRDHSIGDFADFIRSTGPSLARDRLHPQAAYPAKAPIPNSRPLKVSTTFGRLQARDAVVPRSDSISDLIDFVRSGPQLEKEFNRIPRFVANFRATMESNQIMGGAASLPDSRYSQTSVSINSSITSQSALLGNSSSRTRALPSPIRSIFDEEDTFPKRKTRRVRDPYAIDFSDEEDFESMSRPKPIQEESLADFLKNAPLPPEPAPPVAYDLTVSNKGVKKISSSGLMSRLGRSASQVSTTKMREISLGKSTSLQIPNSHGGPKTSRNRVQPKGYQPRDATVSNIRTSDLAEFLMRNEPPKNHNSPKPFRSSLQKVEANAFQRLFGRKKMG